MIIYCKNANVLRKGKIKREEFWISDGRIAPASQQADLVLDFKDQLVAPGYIDLQINGAYGRDFASGQREDVKWAAKALLAHGVTSFYPTVVSSNPERYPAIISSLKPLEKETQGAAILGIHLEGPFFDKESAGAHANKWIRSFEGISSLEQFYGSLEGVKLVTLAPELKDAPRFISDLISRNIVVSAGHTKATFEQMHSAIQNGVSMATHLYNRMTPFHHSAPGVVGAVLTSSLYYSLIVDGKHVHPKAVEMAWRAQPNGAVIVSDGMSGMGMGNGHFLLGEEKVEVKGGCAKNVRTGTLAGSITPIDQAVRNFLKFTHCTVNEALEAASLKPAKALGVFPQKGSLEVGADADFIVLDQNLHVLETYLGGNRVWKKDDNS